MICDIEKVEKWVMLIIIIMTTENRFCHQLKISYVSYQTSKYFLL